MTGEPAFPSDKAGANDGRFRLHNYTTMLLSGLLATQHNTANSNLLFLRCAREFWLRDLLLCGWFTLALKQQTTLFCDVRCD